MNREQRQYVLLGVLVVAFIGAGIYFYLTIFSGPPANYQTPDAVRQAQQGGQQETVAPAQGAPGPAAGPVPQLAADDINIEDLILNVKEVSFDYDASRTARNPMTPLVGQRRTTGEEGGDTPTGSGLIQKARSMLLTGIIWDKENPIAVLDDEVVEEGHVFAGDSEAAGIVVDRIEPSRVILRVDEQLVLLNIEEQ